LRPYFPGGVLIALAPARQGSRPATPSTHRLQRGLPGYLILFAPHAFVAQCQSLSRSPPSPLVFLPISTNFTSTPGIPRPSPALKSHSFGALPVEPGLSPRQMRPPTYALRPIIPNNACTLCITAAAGTELAGASSRGTVIHWAVNVNGLSSLATELYDPKAFITHAAWLRQAFAHCARFPTAASRRSLDRVSVPVWLIILSDQLPVNALVGRYPTN
jgi:hypothetical protein